MNNYIYPSFAFVFVFLSVVDQGSLLQCYKCDLVADKNVGDPCSDSQQLQQCTPPAVCISAPYSFQEGNIKQFTTVKSCAMPDKDACQKFLDNVKANSPGKIEFFQKCYTCNETGCNRNSTSPPPAPSTAAPSAAPSTSSIMTLPALLFVAIFHFFGKPL